MSKKSKKAIPREQRTNSEGKSPQQYTVENMPLEHKQRIVSTINSVFTSLGSTLFPIERSCILTSLIGGQILRQHYKIEAHVTAGEATYHLKTPDGGISVDFQNAVKLDENGVSISHSIVVADIGETSNSAPWLIDFQSPFFNKFIDEFPFKPGLLWDRAYSDDASMLSFTSSKRSAEHLHNQLENARVADLVMIIANWYVPPPGMMKDMPLADLSVSNPETSRMNWLRYVPYEIEDNLTTLITKNAKRQRKSGK
jgi:hypothetical protein